MRPKICVSIPYGINVKTKVEEALKLAEYAELRLDYHPEGPREWAKGIADRLIVTCRKKGEGGLFEGSEVERLELLKDWSGIGPAFIDIELSSLEEGIPEWAEGRLIASWHDFEGTPSTDRLLSLLEEAKRYGGYVKLVTTARRFEDNLKVLGLYRRFKRLIAFCMGELGLLSRVLCPLLGSPFTYTSFGEPTAPGQLDVRELRELYELMGYRF